MKKVLLLLIIFSLFVACTNPLMEAILGKEKDKTSSGEGENSGNIDPLTEQLDSISSTAESDTTYTIEISADAATVPHTLHYPGKSGITIRMKGAEAERTISLSSDGALFTVGDGVKLVLDNNITLKGTSSNKDSLVNVDPGGALVMEEGAKITGNVKNGGVDDAHGGGVSVFGTFTMSGGEISGNYTNGDGDNGGGVQVFSGGTFNMTGGKILGNASQHGGGVSVFDSGTFTMYDGEISGNTAAEVGGGVVVGENGIFFMNGGKISGNTAGSGGGVQVWRGAFTMNGGEISGNTAAEDSGGVNVIDPSGIFNMNGGVIFGNIAGVNGGGASIKWGGTFRIVNGTIYGLNETDENLRNTAPSGAALETDSGSSERGTFNGTTWNSAGTLSTIDNTIKVENGVLQ